jgi:hypothetical protein
MRVHALHGLCMGVCLLCLFAGCVVLVHHASLCLAEGRLLAGSVFAVCLVRLGAGRGACFPGLLLAGSCRCAERLHGSTSAPWLGLASFGRGLWLLSPVTCGCARLGFYRRLPCLSCSGFLLGLRLALRPAPL